MGLVDQFGVALTASDGVAVRHFDAAVSKLLRFNNDPLGEVERALVKPRSRLNQTWLQRVSVSPDTQGATGYWAPSAI